MTAKYLDDLAAAKEAILAACVRYNQVGKMSGLTVSEVRFSRSDGQVEAVDVSHSEALIAEGAMSLPPEIEELCRIGRFAMWYHRLHWTRR